MNLVEKIPIGSVPDVVHVVIEVPLGSPHKMEYDEKMDAFVLDRTLYSKMTYPGNYGFIPQTVGGDHDPLDCIVLTHAPLPMGSVVAVRPVGVLKTEDESGEDMKIVAVPKKDPRFEEIKDIDDVPKAVRNEISDFFEHYKALEPNKWVKVKGWENASVAKEIIFKAAEAFKKK